jgi:hypothetical protein
LEYVWKRLDFVLAQECHPRETCPRLDLGTGAGKPATNFMATVWHCLFPVLRLRCARHKRLRRTQVTAKPLDFQEHLLLTRLLTIESKGKSKKVKVKSAEEDHLNGSLPYIYPLPFAFYHF